MASQSASIAAIRILLLCGFGAALAGTFPAGFVESQVVTGLTSPTCLAFGDQGRIFVSEQQGKIHMIKDGVRLADPWHTVDVEFNDERGLTHIAVDPDFAVNRYLWVYYTAKTPNVHQRLSRFTSAGDRVVPGSEVIILELPELAGGIWHFGGNTNFGTDGKIYLTVGDYEKGSPAQSVESPLGKVLRINRDGSFPSDNPFFASSSGWGRAVWALGFRHPFSGGMQPGTDKFFVNDVGQGTWEEVNEVVRGGNYGWPSMEGNAGAPPAQPGVYQPPVYAYNHSTDGCASIGGEFYNPATAGFPSLYVGDYLTMDFCNGWIRRIRPDRSVTAFATGLSFPTRLKVHPDGSLYYLSRGNRTGPILPGAGSLYRVRYFDDNLPHITAQPQDQSATVSQSVTFEATATGAAPLEYRWQKDGADLPGAAGPAYRIASAGPNDGGTYRVIVSNPAGSDTSRGAVLTLSTDLPPTANIFVPWEGYRWNPGETVTFSGTATNPETGTLPASAFAWKVDYHHETHSHSSVPERTGIAQGTFTLSPLPAEPNTWYRVYLRVADPAGNQTTVFRDIFPANGASRRFFLSDTAWTSATNGLGPVERDLSNGGSAAGDGRTLSLDGVPLAKGLGVNSPSDIRYPLGGKCLLFMAEVGLDDEVGGLGTADFQVYGDGRLLHRTGIRTGADRTLPITVLVEGVSELRLVATDGGDGPGDDHADWGNARLACKHVEPLVDVAHDFSSLNYEVAANAWGPAERDRSNGEAAAGDGRTLTLGGMTFAKGIGVHAASEIRYQLAGQCSEFRAVIGVDDEVGSAGSVRFEIWGDAVRLYQSALLTGSSARVTAVAALAGRQQLRLVVTDGGNGNGKDHADWAGAKLTCKSFPPYPVQKYVSDMTPTSAVNAWGPAEKDRSNGEAAAGDGRILTLDRLTYAKGMGVHANSDLRYSLGGLCQEFRADIGVDDEVGSSGSVAFQVWGDAVKLYQSPVLNGSSPKTGIKVDVRGRSQLRLVVTDGGNGVGLDHADWADARLHCTR